MTVLKPIAFFVLISLSAFASPKPSDPVATVNGKKISFKEFEENYNQNLLYVSDKLVTKEKVIQDLVNRELGIQRAKKLKLEDDPTVKFKMEDVLYHAQVSKDLEPRLQKIVVTDKDVKDYYSSKPEYRTAHILLRVRAITDENEVAAALQQSMKIYNTLKQKPEQFTELANKFSQTNVAPNGGDIGFQPAVRLAPEYFEAINGKSTGFVTPPVRTQFGYHVIKVLAVKNFEEIEVPLYKKIVYDMKRDSILNDYFKELRSKASIQINKDLIK